jgi:hypothetical protein
MYSYGKYIGKICIIAANQKVMFCDVLYQSERLKVDLLFIHGMENENSAWAERSCQLTPGFPLPCQLTPGFPISCPRLQRSDGVSGPPPDPKSQKAFLRPAQDTS